MSLNKYVPLLVVGCIIGLVFVSLCVSQPDDLSQDNANQPAPFPTYGPDNISTTVNTLKGTMIINTSVPESLAVMPVYRLNISGRRTLTINRIPMFQEMSDSIEKHRSTAPVIIPDTTTVDTVSKNLLRKYQGLPDDIVIWKALKFEHPWGGVTPHELYPDEVIIPYTRVIYTRMINGQPVDNWGINHEDFSAGQYGNLVTDHDYVVTAFSENADLVFIIERWTPSEFVSNEPVITAREALDRLKRWENARDDYGAIRNLQVQTIRQGYFEATGYSSIIEPAWFFSGINNDGYDQTVVVLARKNDSAELPFYNWSHQDPLIPDRFAGRYNYNNWTKEHYVSGTGISMENAIDIVKDFSGNPGLIIEDTTSVKENRGCGSFKTIYNISTNEGIYTIDPTISVVRSVVYPADVTHTLENPVEYPQIMKISADYIEKKFRINPIMDLEHDLNVTEYPDTYLVKIYLPDSRIFLSIDKKTGDVVGYTNANALPSICCC